MIQKSTLNFLSALASNNEKAWFDSHQPEYKLARQNFISFVDQLISGLSDFDSDIRNSMLDAKKCMMRINRDIRFSSDKTPYKTNFFAFMVKDGKKSPNAGYYLHIQPGESFMGGGIYMPENTILHQIRESIDSNFSEFLAISNDQTLLQSYPDGIKPSGKLTHPPKGFDKESPAIDFLKFKGFYTQRFLSDHELQSDQVISHLLKSYQAVQPLVSFVNNALT